MHHERRQGSLGNLNVRIGTFEYHRVLGDAPEARKKVARAKREARHPWVMLERLTAPQER
jgi:hypothetical protein